MRAIAVAALLLVGCARFNDALECEQEANKYRIQTVVQDQLCTTGRGLFGGITSTCQAVPRLAYVDTPTSQAYVQACIASKWAARTYGSAAPHAQPHQPIEQRAPGYAPTSHGWTVPPDVIESLRPPAHDGTNPR